jgi:hypothetical protein
MNWMKIEGEELARLKLTVDHAAEKTTDRLAAARMSLPFYRNGSLVGIVGEIGTETAYGSMVEIGDGKLIPLNGRPSQIATANQMAGLHLNIGNVINYAIFYCEFLRAEDGDNFPFVMTRGAWGLDTGRMPDDLEPRVEMIGGGSDAYRVNAYITHAGWMYAAQFEVRNDGVVRMIEEEALGQIVAHQ